MEAPRAALEASTRSLSAVRRFAVDVSDEVGQAGVAEVLPDRGVLSDVVSMP